MLAIGRAYALQGDIRPGQGLPIRILRFGGTLTRDNHADTSPDAKAVTLYNPGGAALQIRSISIAGVEGANFSETNTCDSSLAAHARCIVSVRFMPHKAGLLAATLSIADNGSGSPQDVGLSGRGK
ncbi:MAG: choice-of-anchor D domain-containing protein [Acidobacteriaceae bacterium]